LAGVFYAVGRVRPTAKPLHPYGQLMHGRLWRTGLDDRSGASWLDEPGDDQVLVRFSRAVGLPLPLPDIFGIALRAPAGAGCGDLLFATTGLGRASRFLLRPVRSRDAGTYSTLLPYRSPRGPVLLAARPEAGDSRFSLACALGTGPWQPFASLEIAGQSDPGDADPLLSFDPVLNCLPGLEPYDWVRRVREGAYAAARRSRGERVDAPFTLPGPIRASV
jgi:hypothetical protein